MYVDEVICPVCKRLVAAHDLDEILGCSEEWEDRKKRLSVVPPNAAQPGADATEGDAS